MGLDRPLSPWLHVTTRSTTYLLPPVALDEAEGSRLAVGFLNTFLCDTLNQ
jgi:hypothetical protein